MSLEENKALIRRWFQAFNDRDLAAEATARSTDFAAHVAGAPTPLDGEGWTSFIAAFFAGFPDFRLELDDLLAEGDRVAVRWTFRGTHGGEFLGIAPTGKPVSMSAVEVNRVADGKVAEHWVVLDQLGLLQQLGAIPAPGYATHFCRSVTSAPALGTPSRPCAARSGWPAPRRRRPSG